jgi:hypothetical protein
LASNSFGNSLQIIAIALRRNLGDTTIYMDPKGSQYLSEEGKSCTLQFLDIYMNISLCHII